MINTFLFDLDGTLLPLEWETFEKHYFKRLAAKLSGHFEPELLVKYIWKSTMKMINNCGGEKTNKEVFFEDFTKTTGKDIDVLYPIFDEFYTKEFKELAFLVKAEEYVIKTVNTLIERGYDLVVATNPLFPIEAIEERIIWAGLRKDMFKYITCYDNMHYCKPNIEFYAELLKTIGKEPHECIMVGNDVEEDLISSKIGIKTFLVEEHVINSSGIIPCPDYKGSYEDLYNIVNSRFLAVK